MFRKKGSSSHDEAFIKNQNSVKSKLNENLSHIVKELQIEFKSSNILAHSDSPLVQHLCSCLEAAFIHGLKFSYFEKVSKSSRDGSVLPNPCFWNILQKLSHTETIKQVDGLKYVTTRVGKSRAWIRLALNEGALTSYLTSLVSKEFKKVVSYYYDSHGIFLDGEHADIFLQYLQGIGNIQFDTSYNSSMLNQWTRTPMELAGLIPPSTSVPLYTGLKARTDNNNYETLSPIQSDSRSSYHDVSSRSFLSPVDMATRHRHHHRSSDRSFVTHGRTSSETSSEKQRSSTPRCKEDTKTSNGDVDIVMSSVVQPPKVKDEREEAAPILHTRHLMKRRKKRRKLQASKHHSWSSLSSASSSGNSFTSNSRSNTPRSSSICSTPPAVVLTKNAADVETLPEGNLHQSKFKFSIKVSEELQKLNSRTNSSEDLKKEVRVDKEEDPGKKEDFLENHKKTDNANTNTVNIKPSQEAVEANKTLESATGEDSVLDDSTSSHLSAVTNKMNAKLNEQMKLQGAYKLSYVTSSSGDELDHDKQPDTPTPTTPSNDLSAVDIYTHSPSTENTAMNRSKSRSGNSLLHSMSGWSDHPPPSKTSVSSHSLHSNTSTSHSLPSNIEVKLEEEGVFIRREGSLQKLGEKLKLWKKRWFILRGKMLTYYKDHSSSDILGCITLSEIDLITEETNEKGEFCICLHGNDGKEYRLRDEDKKVLLDWKKDFQEVITGVTSIESSTEQQQQQAYVDEYEVISVRSHLLNNVSTSWHSAMLVHMTKIAQEKGLDTQNYQCADCASPIGIIYGKPRLCIFTGQNYCSQCHLNEESIIPARIIHNWDFRKDKVAKRSKKFLDQVYADPVINLNESNPVIYKYVDEMSKLLLLRTQLMHVKPYLQTCKTIHPDQIFTRLKTRLHFLESIHLYSVRDLCHILDKELPTVLSKIINYGIKHVTNCSLCTAKGFLCEICHKDEIIFPFQTATTVQCNECKALFHKLCKLDSIKCPKCERREMRCLKSMQETRNEYLLDSDNTDSDFVDSLT